jgi:hypothetical protein
MSLFATIDQLKTTFARADQAYARGRARHTALAPYDSASAALAAIDRGSRLSAGKQDAVLFAVIEEMRQGPCSLWQALLVVAFAPMLVGIRARMRRPRCDDLDQRVLIAFIEAARAVGAPRYVHRQLHFGVRRRLYAEGGREHRARDVEPFDDETYAADLFGKDRERKAEAVEILRALEAQRGEALCEAMLERWASGESFRVYVDRTYADLPPRERARLCDRIGRSEHAALRKLRERAERGERLHAYAD